VYSRGVISLRPAGPALVIGVGLSIAGLLLPACHRGSVQPRTSAADAATEEKPDAGLADGPAFVDSAGAALPPHADAMLANAPDDANAQSQRCDRTHPFGTPLQLASLNVTAGVPAVTRHAHLSSDLLAVYYTWGSDFYSATRPTAIGDTFANLAPLAALNTGAPNANNLSPTVARDGLTIYFASNRSGHVQIYFATRPARAALFGAPALVAGLESTANVTYPFVQGDGSTIYFASEAPNGGPVSRDIYRAPLPRPGVAGPIEQIPELSTPADDGPIAVTADGLTAYVSRPRSADGAPAAHLKIWSASRSAPQDPFSQLSAVTELAGPDSVNDDVSWVSDDGCSILLSSFRGGTGSNVYEARRVP
jgi:hypothetical protein